MKKSYNTTIKIPNGITCQYSDGAIVCKKGSAELRRPINVPKMKVKVENDEISLTLQNTNKKERALIETNAAHLRNMFKGLNDKFVYEMEVCYVHFPMTVKVDGKKFVISNFLGEKVNRSADILDDVEVKVTGQKITVSGHDIEKTGQTAANIEKASKVLNKDRRIFQDGCFITKKPKGAI